MLDAYRYALTNVKLWGPTNAAPIISHVSRFAEQADKNPEAQVSSETALYSANWTMQWTSLFLCGAISLELLHLAHVD